MSYGAGSGEGYMSELTWAFLEDTGLYRIPNDVGGRLIDDITVTGQCNETSSTSSIDLIFGNIQSSDVSRPASLGPSHCSSSVSVSVSE